MTLIYMLETKSDTPDGFNLYDYEENKTYDVPHSLAAKFINCGWGLELAPEDMLPSQNQIRLSTYAMIIPFPNKAMAGFNAGHEARKIYSMPIRLTPNDASMVQTAKE